MVVDRTTERNDAHVRENLVDPGLVVKVDEKAAEAAREALRKSTPPPIKAKKK